MSKRENIEPILECSINYNGSYYRTINKNIFILLSKRFFCFWNPLILTPDIGSWNPLMSGLIEGDPESARVGCCDPHGVCSVGWLRYFYSRCGDVAIAVS